MKQNTYILSRLALKGKNFNMTPKWIRNRLNLFENTCYKSICEQTDQNFKWFLCSTESMLTQEQVARLKTLSKDNIRFVFLEDKKSWQTFLREIIKEESKNVDKVLTMRVDSDDILAHDFVEVAKNLSLKTKQNNDVVINYSSGYEFFNKQNRFVLRSRRDTNMFISLSEDAKKDEYKLCIFDQHPRMNKHFDVIQWNDRPMWLQLLHGKNIYTHRPMGKQRITELEDIKSRFSNEDLSDVIRNSFE